MTTDGRAMPHLDETQLVDAVEGVVEAVAAAHLDDCDTCAARVRQMRGMIQALTEDPVPEPSPLFWDQFARRVSGAIDAPDGPRRWLTAPRLAWAGAVAALLVIAMLLPLRDAADTVAPGPADRAGSVAPTEGTTIAYAEPEPEDFDDDEAWTVVRSVAEDADYDDVHDVGLTPQAGSVERAAMELSDRERAELGRLIALELKRTGASTP